MPCFKCFL